LRVVGLRGLTVARAAEVRAAVARAASGRAFLGGAARCLGLSGSVGI